MSTQPDQTQVTASMNASNQKKLIQTQITSSFHFLPQYTPTRTASEDTARAKQPRATPGDTPPKRRLSFSEGQDPAARPFRPSYTSTKLSLVAKETKHLLPGLLKQLAGTGVTTDGILLDLADLPSTNHPHPCPKFSLPTPTSPLAHAPAQYGTRIRVVDDDTLDVALALQQREPRTPADWGGVAGGGQQRVVVLNMANALHGGGGWLKGALAQEEALCYRSSLAFTLKRRHYPLPPLSGIYSPTVVVFRDALGAGHTLRSDVDTPARLPVLSAISVAAQRDPFLTRGSPPLYQRAGDRERMKGKIRLILSMAMYYGHHRLVLGALGCGAFNNPRGECAQCWAEVFQEAQFQGGWWSDVVFAVMDGGGARQGKDGDGNYGVFYQVLDGMLV
ncbi:MAG: hypothetical protein M1829_001793 [Trizodia sp. TS-e1964]|nr:MAG: hypothetical protein M1829_001793 [Trizodia sp. TS-e1964]